MLYFVILKLIFITGKSEDQAAVKAMDASNIKVVIKCKAIITALCAAFLPDKEFELLRRAQQYSVNVLPNLLVALVKAEVLKEIQEGTGILYLADSRYYSEEFGLSDTPEGLMEVLCVSP